MLESLLPGIRGFGGANRIWHMAYEWDALLTGLVGDSKYGIARNQRLQFDEIGSALLQVIDGAASVFGSGDGYRTGEARLWAVEHWA